MRGKLIHSAKWLLATVAVVFVTLSVTTHTTVAQPYTDNVGIGTAAPDPSALLELRANDKGFLITRMSQPERDLITLPATGLMIYNTTRAVFQYNIGTPQNPIWVSMLYINIDGGSSSGVFWSLLGNDSVDRAVNFLGTTNAQPLIIKTDNAQRAVFTELGFFDVTANTTITGSLNLLGDTTSLMMKGDPGAVGNPLISQGPGTTPRWFPLIAFSDTLTRIDTRLRVTEKAVFDSLPQIPFATDMCWWAIPTISPYHCRRVWKGRCSRSTWAIQRGSPPTKLIIGRLMATRTPTPTRGWERWVRAT